MLLKQLRLAALLDAPTAFGSTFAKESQFTDTDWADKAALWSGAGGGRSTCCVALDGDAPVGIAAGYVPSDGPTSGHAWLVSMWVHPLHRGQGLGRRLIASVERWARGQGLEELRLEVTIGNTAAQRLYEAAGFRVIGDPVPHPVYAELREHVMVKPLRLGTA